MILDVWPELKQGYQKSKLLPKRNSNYRLWLHVHDRKKRPNLTLF